MWTLTEAVYEEVLRPVPGALFPSLGFCTEDYGLCFILVVPFAPPPFLAFLLVFVLIFSGWSCLFGFPLFLLSVDVCLACVYFSIMIFLWVLFSFAIFFFFQGSFVLPGAVSPLHIDVNTDCWFWTFLGEGAGVGCGRTALKGLRERMLGGWSGQWRRSPYFADTHFSSWPEVWHFFPRVLRVFGPAWFPSLPPTLFLYPVALEPRFPSSASCFLWSTFYISCSSLLWSAHLEGGCFKGSTSYW